MAPLCKRPLAGRRWRADGRGMLAFLIEKRRWMGTGILLTFGSSFGQTWFISHSAAQIKADYKFTAGTWEASAPWRYRDMPRFYYRAARLPIRCARRNGLPCARVQWLATKYQIVFGDGRAGNRGSRRRAGRPSESGSLGRSGGFKSPKQASDCF